MRLVCWCDVKSFSMLNAFFGNWFFPNRAWLIYFKVFTSMRFRYFYKGRNSRLGVKKLFYFLLLLLAKGVQKT